VSVLAPTTYYYDYYSLKKVKSTLFGVRLRKSWRGPGRGNRNVKKDTRLHREIDELYRGTDFEKKNKKQSIFVGASN